MELAIGTVRDWHIGNIHLDTKVLVRDWHIGNIHLDTKVLVTNC